jgi:hypothetical protein
MSEPIDVRLDPEDGSERGPGEIIVRPEDVREPVRSTGRVANASLPPTISPRPSGAKAAMRGPVIRSVIAGVSSSLAVGVLIQAFFGSRALSALSGGFLECAAVTALCLGAAGGAIGAAMAMAEPLSQGHIHLAGVRGVKGLLFGALGGIAGGFLAESAAVAIAARSAASASEPSAAASHGLLAGSALGWLVTGVGIGLGRKLMSGRERSYAGLLSGLIGGAIGGVGVGLAGTSEVYQIPLALHVALFGTVVGVAAGAIDENTRGLRLQAIRGPLEGAIYSLPSGATRLGSSSGCEVLLPDRRIAPVQCEIVVGQSDVLLRDLSGGTPVMVNGEPCASHLLMPGDVILAGDHHLRYDEDA